MAWFEVQLGAEHALQALFAGLAFSNTKTAIAHSLSYPITLRHGVQHGIACSFSLPMVLRSVHGVDDPTEQVVAEPGVDISVIVTDPADNGAADDAIGDAAAETKIKAIYEQLKGGADFATVASQRTEDQASAARAGQLGFATAAQLKQAFPTRPDLSDRLMTMSAGQYTEPIKDSISGKWYIIKLNGKRETTQNYTLKDVRQTIIDAITQQRQQVLLNALLTSTLAEISQKNYLADRIVQNPETMTVVKPSELLGPGAPLPQPAPRIENQNQNAAAPGPRVGASPAAGNSNKGSRSPAGH